VILAVAGNAKTFWYLTRGLGVAALLLLTASVALGVLTTVRWRSTRWPRFATAALHRNLTLLAICFVVAHVVTTIVDGYTTIGLKDAVIPFLSSYRPIWLGLGAVAFDLLLALVVTSLLRGADRVSAVALRALARLCVLAGRAPFTRSAPAATRGWAGCNSSAPVRSPSSRSPHWRVSPCGLTCRGPRESVVGSRPSSPRS